MPILFQYIAKQTIKVFSIVIIVVSVIYLSVDFFEKVDDFMEMHINVATMISYFCFKIPFIVVQIMPVAILIASLIVFGIMRKNNEVVAVKSSGIGTMTLMKPAAFCGICFCALLFLLSELIIPETMNRANFIWLQQVRNKTAAVKKQSDIWLKDNKTLLHIKHYNPGQQTAHDVTINYMNDNFMVIKRIDAQKCVYKDEKWHLKNIMVTRFDDNGSLLDSRFPKNIKITLDVRPEDLGMAAKSTDEMGIAELYRDIKNIEAQGYNTTLFRVNFQARLAFPFVCLLMSIIGAGVGVSGRARGGITANVAYGVGASFAYWILHSFCLSLGYGGMLPPLLAAWAANIVFAFISFIILINIK